MIIETIKEATGSEMRLWWHIIFCNLEKFSHKLARNKTFVTPPAIFRSNLRQSSRVDCNTSSYTFAASVLMKLIGSWIDTCRASRAISIKRKQDDSYFPYSFRLRRESNNLKYPGKVACFRWQIDTSEDKISHYKTNF